MKILALNFNRKGVGTWRRSFYFSRELARAGHEVTLATVSRDSRFRWSECWKRDWAGESVKARGPGPWIRVIEGPAWGYQALPGYGSGPLDIWGRLRELRRGSYEAVFGFEYQPNVSWPVYLARHTHDFRFFSDWCDWFGGSANRFRGWRIAHRIDRYFEERIRFAAETVSVTSRLLAERARRIGIPAEKIRHIPEGAATDYIAPLDQREARLRCKLPAERPLVAAIRQGEMLREMRVFREVLKRVPNAGFLMIGSISRAAMAFAEREGMAERVFPSGWVSNEDYPWFLAAADVCFCPLDASRNDRARWPAKILDFLSAGRATVTNPVGEVARLFRESRVGISSGHAEEEMGAAIAELLRKPDEARSLGESARSVMVREWDWRHRGAQIASMLGS